MTCLGDNFNSISISAVGQFSLLFVAVAVVVIAKDVERGRGRVCRQSATIVAPHATLK